MIVRRVDARRREEHLTPAELLEPHRLESEFVDVPPDRAFDVGHVQHDVIETDDPDHVGHHSEGRRSEPRSGFDRFKHGAVRGCGRR